jgi:hypothetical protein
MKRMLAVLPAVVLAACAGTATAPVPPPINSLIAAENAVLFGDQAIAAYEKLPPCPTAAPLCQTPAVKAELKIASAKAYAAIVAARPIIEANPNGGSAATAAVTDLNAATAAFAVATSALPKAS